MAAALGNVGEGNRQHDGRLTGAPGSKAVSPHRERNMGSCHVLQRGESRAGSKSLLHDTSAL